MLAAGCGASNPRSTTVVSEKAPKTRGEYKVAPAKKSAADITSLRKMIGQTIVSHVAGLTAPAGLLDRVRSGSVGGVILFGQNTSAGPAALRRLIESLQSAARAGGNPPLLVMTDQEGGDVKRLPWAPPDSAPAEMQSAAVAQQEGEVAGQALRAVGINLDLAPVADVVGVQSSFLGERAFGTDPRVVAERACAFASGLEKQGVGFTLKHFPGLGLATANTDEGPVTITASASTLRADFAPYELCASRPGGVVMVSNAAYPALTGNDDPAVLDRRIYESVLGSDLGFQGPTISDDLQAGALTGQSEVGERALAAGLDLLLFASTEAASTAEYRSLVAAAEAGRLSRGRIEAAYNAVWDYKHRDQATEGVRGTGSKVEDYPGGVGGAQTLTEPGR
jgi:beta-N-acetylhexosaminidase